MKIFYLFTYSVNMSWTHNLVHQSVLFRECLQITGRRIQKLEKESNTDTTQRTDALPPLPLGSKESRTFLSRGNELSGSVQGKGDLRHILYTLGTFLLQLTLFNWIKLLKIPQDWHVLSSAEGTVIRRPDTIQSPLLHQVNTSQKTEKKVQYDWSGCFYKG